MTGPAITYVLDDVGRLIDIVIPPKSAPSTPITFIELELVRMCREWKELRILLAGAKEFKRLRDMDEVRIRAAGLCEKPPI